MTTRDPSDFLLGLPPAVLGRIAAQSELPTEGLPDEWRTAIQNVDSSARGLFDTMSPDVIRTIVQAINTDDMRRLDEVVHEVSEEPWLRDEFPNFWDEYVNATQDPDHIGNRVPGTGPGTVPTGGGVGGGGIIGVTPRDYVYVVCTKGHLNSVTIPTGLTSLVSGRLNEGEAFPAPPHYGYFDDPIVDCSSDSEYETFFERHS